MQSCCDTLSEIKRKLNTGETFKSRSGRKFYFIMKDNLIVRKCLFTPNHKEFNNTVLVIPSQCRSTVLKVAHDLPTAGHFSHRKTELKVCTQCLWPGISTGFRRYCRSCDQYQRTSARGRTHKVQMSLMPIMSIPFERIGIDLVGPISRPSSLGHRYILTIIDYATSFLEAVPLKEITTIAVSEALMSIF